MDPSEVRVLPAGPIDTNRHYNNTNLTSSFKAAR